MRDSMFAKYITRLKLRRIVRKLQKQRDLMRRELGLESPSEHGRNADLVRDQQRVTYIYGAGVSEWEGTTHWDNRENGNRT